MKNHKHDFKTEAHIAATYKAFVTHPKSSIKPFNSDFLSTLIISNQTPPNTDRIANTKTISLLTPRSISSLQRPKTERPPHLSKTAAEYHEIPFRNSNREYEIFQKLFKEKVVEDVGVGLPKYEKKGVIQEIIEKEYNFNRYGEVKRPSQTKRRKSSLKIAGSLSKTRISSNNNYVYGTLGQNLTNLKGKIRFSYQKMEEEEEEVVKRPKIDKEFFETIRTNYVKKIRTIFQDKQVKESQKIAENELERLLEEFKIFIDQTNEEK